MLTWILLGNIVLSTKDVFNGITELGSPTQEQIYGGGGGGRTIAPLQL